MNIKVIDNFANTQEQITILETLEKSDNYSFKHSCVGSLNNKTKLTVDYPHITRTIFDSGPTNTNCFIDPELFSLTYFLLHKNNLSDHVINRIKININFPFPNNTKENHGPIHTDFINPIYKGTSIIYYINNCDGDTVFFDKTLKEVKRISPKQGRAVVFDSNIYHAGSCPINFPSRPIVNYVLYK